ncbi:MAG: hypothetical protein KDJ88_13065 [Bauldia sp.]|nr:hypothetical protein [Bauldia sp.]
MEDKVIVTHGAALHAKYDNGGVGKIRTALAALVQADKARGFLTRVVYLDDVAVMKKLRAPPLRKLKDPRGAKKAIDGVYKALKPDYILILGSADVVPHQDLRNPAQEPQGDKTAYGDLPYACDAPYDRDPANFVGPTRVVGRLPDLTGATEPSYLLGLLKTAATWKSRPVDDYKEYFGLSADEWKGSTGLSLDNIFGSDKKLKLSPKRGPNFPSSALKGMMHFINCHGATGMPEFYGQNGQSYPKALTSKSTDGKVREGTIAAAECCFGAELYNSVILGGIPICQNYLRQGAYGFVGSTTIAYGPADGNGAADLICQYFLLAVLDGASLGRAMLMARQQYVAGASQMDPIDLKTLAQFCLYGDPSIHAVAAPHAVNTPHEADPAAAFRFRRSERRAKLRQTGDFLQATKPTASSRDMKHAASPNAEETLAKIAASAGLDDKPHFVTYKVKGAPPARGGGKKVASAPSRYYVAIERPPPKSEEDRYRVAVVAKELDGRIVDYCVYYER